MNKMKMKMGDFFDRYTILLQKAEFDEAAKQELVQYEAEIKKIIVGEVNAMVGAVEDRPVGILSLEFIRSLCKLSLANAKVWENEAAIRSDYVNDPAAKATLTLEQVGQRTLTIRKHNRNRVQSKSSIDKMFGDVPDNKVNHASE